MRVRFPPGGRRQGAGERRRRQGQEQFREDAGGERLAVERAVAEAGKERMHLEWARHEFAAYRSVARLLGGEERLAA